MLPKFHARLTATGWILFSPEPCKAGEKWVRDFYANISVVSTKNSVMIIQGKKVNFGAEQVNVVYGLPNVKCDSFLQEHMSLDPGWPTYYALVKKFLGPSPRNKF